MDSQLSFCFRMRCFFCTPIKVAAVGLMAKQAIHLSDLSKPSFCFGFLRGLDGVFGRSHQQSFFCSISFVPFADPMAACKAEGWGGVQETNMAI